MKPEQTFRVSISFDFDQLFFPRPGEWPSIDFKAYANEYQNQIYTRLEDMMSSIGIYSTETRNIKVSVEVIDDSNTRSESPTDNSGLGFPASRD